MAMVVVVVEGGGGGGGGGGGMIDSGRVWFGGIVVVGTCLFILKF
jgi:hypothetical protein